MKAIHIIRHGDAGTLHIQELPKPKPGRGEVLVRLKAAGVNFVDIYMRSGYYGTPPFTLGLEGAGIVEELGEGVTNTKIGDRVAYANSLGSYAEYCVVKAPYLIPIPKAFSFEEGAAFPLQGLTTQYLLHEFYHIKPGDNVLVHAAAGGMGLFLIQWLKHMKARIIGTVSSEQKARKALDTGADHVIIYTKQDFALETKNLTGGKGADYIIDGVGKSTFRKDLDAVRVRGHICIFGAASGPADPFVPNELMAKSITLSGGNLMNYFTPVEEFQGRVRDLLKGLEDGWLKPTVGHIFPLEKASDAHQSLEKRTTTGKVVLTIGES